MRDYSRDRKQYSSLESRAIEKQFYAQYKYGMDGADCTKDNGDKFKAVIQKHSNPINSHLMDKYFMALKSDEDKINWGDYFEANQNGNKEKYMILTNPESVDGVLLKSKIRRVDSKCRFTVKDVDYTYQCIGTNQLLYDGTTYKTDTVVFQDDDRKAIVLKYDEITKQIDYIDTIYINGEKYKAILIEHLTDDEKTGVVQIVAIRTLWGDVYRGEELLDVILTFARMKDKNLNSKSREIISRHGVINTGDYLDYYYSLKDTNTLEDRTELRTYIVVTIPDVKLDYDITYAYQCESYFNLWNDETKEIVKIPCYVDDNIVKFMNNDTSMVDASYAQYRIIVQDNKYTSMLFNEIKRIIINGRAYEITGIDNMSLNGVIHFGLTNSQIDPNNDDLDNAIADFYKAYSKEVITPVLEIVGDTMCPYGDSYEYSIDTTDTIVWEITSGSEFLDFNVQNNNLVLYIKDSVKNIGKKITIKATFGGNVLEKEVYIASWR